MRFLLLLAPEYRSGAKLSAAELGARTAGFSRWVDALRRCGALRAGARLSPRGGRITLEREGNSRAPAGGEGAATLGHYFVIEAPGWDAALRLAASCPGAAPGVVDVFALEAEASA